MLEKLTGIKDSLSELAAVLNKFNSEAVQLRLLDALLGTVPHTPESVVHKKGKAGKSKATSKNPVSVPSPESGGKPVKKKAATSGTGANATLTQLMTTDFFSKQRTISDIIKHCKDNLARSFAANEFSGKLGRMVRSGELKRKKNGDNQYEYQKP